MKELLTFRIQQGLHERLREEASSKELSVAELLRFILQNRYGFALPEKASPIAA